MKQHIVVIALSLLVGVSHASAESKKEVRIGRSGGSSMNVVVERHGSETADAEAKARISKEAIDEAANAADSSAKASKKVYIARSGKNAAQPVMIKREK